MRFTPPAALQRTHHVHMTALDGEIWRRLLFRDYLRSHPDEAQRNAALKLDLVARHRQDREAYTAAKSAYVDEVMAKAGSVGNHDNGNQFSDKGPATE